MIKDFKTEIFQVLKRYLNGFIESDIDMINSCIAYPLAHEGNDKVTMLKEFPIDLEKLKQEKGWATSDNFEIDIVSVSEQKAHALIRNCRRIRKDGSLIEEASGFYAFQKTSGGWKIFAFSDITIPA